MVDKLLPPFLQCTHTKADDRDRGLLEALGNAYSHKCFDVVDKLLPFFLRDTNTAANIRERGLLQALVNACKHTSSHLVDMMLASFLNYFCHAKDRYTGLSQIVKEFNEASHLEHLQKILPLLVAADKDYRSPEKEHLEIIFSSCSPRIQKKIESILGRKIK